ncbi:hypothetical protein HK104_007686 [Borealophlyctis nickersoniae]|nr:hypothetical protein HK104_007686 [Borealophlyctis nickersoniae]
MDPQHDEDTSAEEQSLPSTRPAEPPLAPSTKPMAGLFDGLSDKTQRSNIKKSTMGAMDKVYEQLDPDHEKEKGAADASRVAEEAGAERAGGAAVDEVGDSMPGSVNSPVKDMKHAAVEGVEAIFSTIDKTFDFASHALGTTLMTGYKKLEEAKLGERALETVSSITRELDQSVRHHGNQSVGALENLGKKAMEIVGTTTGLVDTPATERNSSPAFGQAAGRPKIVQLFEDNSGTAHLQALEMLSTESQLKLTTFTDCGASEFRGIETSLDADALLEEADARSGLDLAPDETFEKQLALLKRLGSEIDTQIRSLRGLSARISGSWSTDKITAYERDLMMLDGDPAGAQLATEEFLDSLFADSATILASFAEKSCEQLLRVAEVLLMQIAEERLRQQTGEAPKEDGALIKATERAHAIRSLAVDFLSTVRWASGKYISTIQGIETIFKDKHRETTRALKAVAHKCELLEANITNDTDYVMAAIQEASLAIVPILKLLHATYAAKAGNTDSS